MDGPLERRIGEVKVRIHRDSCIGTGACVNAAPEVFRLDSRQTVSFTEPPAEIDRQRLVDACQYCPVDALEAIGPDGEKLAP